MGFVSVTEFQQKNSGTTGRRGGWRSKAQEDLVIAQDIGGKGNGGHRRWSLRLRISERLMKQARWVEGDRIDMLFDVEARLGLLRRVNAGGNALCRRNGAAGAVVQSTWYPGMPSLRQSAACLNVVVDEEGLLFEMPPEVSFTENLREDAAHPGLHP